MDLSCPFLAVDVLDQVSSSMDGGVVYSSSGQECPAWPSDDSDRGYYIDAQRQAGSVFILYSRILLGSMWVYALQVVGAVCSYLAACLQSAMLEDNNTVAVCGSKVPLENEDKWL